MLPCRANLTLFFCFACFLKLSFPCLLLQFCFWVKYDHWLWFVHYFFLLLNLGLSPRWNHCLFNGLMLIHYLILKLVIKDTYWIISWWFDLFSVCLVLLLHSRVSHFLFYVLQKREQFQDLAPLLWNSFGTIAALLQVCYVSSTIYSLSLVFGSSCYYLSYESEINRSP